jgi:hypothetical protein
VSTAQSKGVTWAYQRDNFVDGVLYVSGRSSSDTDLRGQPGDV